jgi:DNA invertase Pin-like site-specific DNA recombinase
VLGAKPSSSAVSRTVFPSMYSILAKVYAIKEGYELGDNINSKVLAFAFGSSAEIERNLISQRTKEALARLKAEGKKLGRPFGSKKKNPKLLTHGEFIRNKVAEGAKQAEIANELKVDRHTVRKWIKENLEFMDRDIRVEKFIKSGEKSAPLDYPHNL